MLTYLTATGEVLDLSDLSGDELDGLLVKAGLGRATHGLAADLENDSVYFFGHIDFSISQVLVLRSFSEAVPTERVELSSGRYE